MDILELGAIGELVGGVAVIATLAYLAVQVRHAKTELQMVRFEKVMEDYNDFYRQLATQEIATIWAKATTEYRSLQDHERIQFHALATQRMGTYEQSRTSWADESDPPLLLPWIGRSLWETTRDRCETDGEAELLELGLDLPSTPVILG